MKNDMKTVEATVVLDQETADETSMQAMFFVKKNGIVLYGGTIEVVNSEDGEEWDATIGVKTDETFLQMNRDFRKKDKVVVLVDPRYPDIEMFCLPWTRLTALQIHSLIRFVDNTIRNNVQMMTYRLSKEKS